MHFHKSIVAGCSLALGLATSVAAPSDASDAPIATPEVRYQSAFDGYVAHQEWPAGNWREHNDAVGHVGGHAGHLKGRASTIEPATPKDAVDHGAHGK